MTRMYLTEGEALNSTPNMRCNPPDSYIATDLAHIYFVLLQINPVEVGMFY